MKTLRQNLVKAYEVLEWLTRREQRKCNLVVSSAGCPADPKSWQNGIPRIAN